ncbi:MAG: UDP-N-acetylmuramoyl-tripeptide--D-alanyl-D-alanine ligase [Ilumatobacteraceae bacterium]
MLIRASHVVTATGGVLRGADVSVDGASFDTRSLRPGQLFVPIVADRDGHDYVASAASAGAAATLWARAAEPGVEIPTVTVADTAVALMALAEWARPRLDAVVVGITGSVGKTSTKDLVRAAVGAGRRVAANERSFNNEQGLPVTLLGAADDTEVLVLEMGMRGPGEIRRLCAVGRPDIGVVTAVAPAHTERVGGIDGVARAKAELVEALPDTGTAVLNADDDRVAAMAARTSAGVVTFGRSAGADVRIVGLALDGLARARFTAETPWGPVAVALGVSGAHMAANAAAAIAVAGLAGVDLHDAAAALGRAEMAAMRMQVVAAASGGVVVNDAYNANPTSMGAGLDALAAMTARRRIAVLGEMAELDDPGPAHLAVASRAEELGIELIAVGTDRYGVTAIEATEVAARLGPIGPGVTVLVKASRAVGLDAVAAALVVS